MSSSGYALIRFTTCLVLLALLPACDRTPPPEKPVVTATTPEEIPVASEFPPPPSNVPARVLLPFSTDDVRIGTEIGERSLGLGMATTGRTGWLLFGPYIPLPAGQYQVELRGSAHEGHSGVVHVDVAQGKGTQVIAAAEIDGPALLAPLSPDGLVVLPFTLTHASSNLEIRVRVTESAKLSVLGYVIRSLP